MPDLDLGNLWRSFVRKLTQVALQACSSLVQSRKSVKRNRALMYTPSPFGCSASKEASSVGVGSRQSVYPPVLALAQYATASNQLRSPPLSAEAHMR